MGVRDFQMIVQQIPQQVWCAGSDGGIVYLNQCWVDYAGMGLQAACGWGWQPIVEPSALAALIAEWERARGTQHAYDKMVRLRRSVDGMYRWHLARGVAVRDADGTVSGWLGTNTDVDDLYEARQVRALERVLASGALEAVIRRLVTAYGDVVDYERSGVLARRPTGEPVSDAPAMTLRELEVLRLIAEGYDNREIGRRLHYSTGTIKGHVRSILEKTESRDRTSAAVRAVRLGLI